MADSESTNEQQGGLPPPPPPPLGDNNSQQANQQSTPAHNQQPPTSRQQQPQPAAAHQQQESSVSTEEYVEAVIEERWVDIEEDIRRVVEWKNRSEQRITQLSQQFEDLKDRFDKLHAALIGKIESYDKNILEVGAELKAMEKVFSKVMPAFTENVKQLDDMTKRLKK